MTAAASSGDFTVYLQSIDAYTNVTFNMSVTGINAGDTQITMANKALPQFITQLAASGFNYVGSPVFTSNNWVDTSIITPVSSPVFSNQLGLATWRITWSEHILCFFSESNFILNVVSSSTGAIIQTTGQSSPILATVDDARNDGPLSGLVLEDIQGNLLTDQQVTTLLSFASAKLVSYLRNNIMICTYVWEGLGNWQRSFFLNEGIPGIYYDGVRVKRPYSVSLFGTLIGDSTSVVWNYIRPTGELNYLPNQNLVNTFEPSAAQNEIKISYVGGNFTIPVDITQAIMTIAARVLENKSDVSELKTGSWGVKFKDKDLREQIQEELYTYMLWGWQGT